MKNSFDILLVKISARNALEKLSNQRVFGISHDGEAVRIGLYPNARRATEHLFGEYQIVIDPDQIEQRLTSIFTGTSQAMSEITKFFDIFTGIGVVQLTALDEAGKPIVKFVLRRTGGTVQMRAFDQVGHAVGAARQQVAREQPEDAAPVSSPAHEAGAHPVDERVVPDGQAPVPPEPLWSPSSLSGSSSKGPR